MGNRRGACPGESGLQPRDVNRHALFTRSPDRATPFAAALASPAAGFCAP